VRNYRQARNGQCKNELFIRLAQHDRVLASEVERAIKNAIKNNEAYRELSRPLARCLARADHQSVPSDKPCCNARRRSKRKFRLVSALPMKLNALER
jgi:hypothetical protein